jgi:hypothetical protein
MFLEGMISPEIIAKKSPKGLTFNLNFSLSAQMREIRIIYIILA